MLTLLEAFSRPNQMVPPSSASTRNSVRRAGTRAELRSCSCWSDLQMTRVVVRPILTVLPPSPNQQFDKAAEFRGCFTPALSGVWLLSDFFNHNPVKCRIIWQFCKKKIRLSAVVWMTRRSQVSTGVQSSGSLILKFPPGDAWKWH